MATRSPEGGNPHNIDPSTLRVAPHQRRFGSGFTKPEETAETPEQPAQNPTSPYQELAEHLRRNLWSVVIGGRGWGHERFERLKDIDKG
jgi:hypothetical protein